MKMVDLDDARNTHIGDMGEYEIYSVDPDTVAVMDDIEPGLHEMQSKIYGLISIDMLKTYIRENGLCCDTAADKEAVCKVIDSFPRFEMRPVITCACCRYSADPYNDDECYCTVRGYLEYVRDWSHSCSWAAFKVEASK